MPILHSAYPHDPQYVWWWLTLNVVDWKDGQRGVVVMNSFANDVSLYEPSGRCLLLIPPNPMQCMFVCTPLAWAPNLPDLPEAPKVYCV
jgi:hypothetical protein